MWRRLLNINFHHCHFDKKSCIVFLFHRGICLYFFIVCIRISSRCQLFERRFASAKCHSFVIVLSMNVPMHRNIRTIKGYLSLLSSYSLPKLIVDLYCQWHIYSNGGQCPRSCKKVQCREFHTYCLTQ